MLAEEQGGDMTLTPFVNRVGMSGGSSSRLQLAMGGILALTGHAAGRRNAAARLISGDSGRFGSVASADRSRGNVA